MAADTAGARVPRVHRAAHAGEAPARYAKRCRRRGRSCTSVSLTGARRSNVLPLAYAEYMDRFNPAFIERRRQALQRFLDRISVHPTLQKSDHLRLFLEAKAWVRPGQVS